jgi:hypothetical protein
MNTKELIEQLAATGSRCLAMESVTAVKTAADNFRQALAVLDSTAAVMECASKFGELDRLVQHSEALKAATEAAHTTLSSTQHYLEHMKGQG